MNYYKSICFKTVVKQGSQGR